MKLTVLMENNAIVGNYMTSESALSFFLEVDGKRVLWDMGYSGAYIENAMKLGIDLTDLDFVVLSHGHYDHTNGIYHYIKYVTEKRAKKKVIKKPIMIMHPDAMIPKITPVGNIGMMLSEEELSHYFDLQFSKQGMNITENLFFLGEIERKNDFEKVTAASLGNRQDSLLEDTALAYKTAEGIVVVAGCSHAGICNTCEQAKKVTGESKIIDIIGGFHLLGPEKAIIDKTVEYLASLGLESIHPCHCTDLSSKIAIGKAIPVKEVGVGKVFEY
ncbi:MAG: MBL fold metallo-hydrolase [Peptostreptococcales bacterium]